MNTVDILDRLIAISIDSQKRYRHAAEDVERVSLEEFFKWQADNRKTAADELMAVRTRLYGKGQENGTLAGTADRVAMDFAVIMSKGDTGVVEWCRQDDEAVIKEYESALTETMSEDTRLLLQRQLARVRSAVGKLEEVLAVFGEPRS